MNVKTNNEKIAERKDHFAIRKLTVGAASVLIGTSLWLGSTNAVAKADTQENNDQNSDANVVSESNKAVNTQKVDKVVVETQQSTANEAPSTNEVPAADTNADNQAQTQKVAEKPAETQKTESSETKSPVVNSNETTLSEKQDQDKVESSQVTSGELNTKQEEKQNNTSVVENNKVETASPTTEQNNKQLEDQNKAVTNQNQVQTPQVSDKNQEYSVNITNIDDSTGQTLYGTDSFKAKAGDKSHRIYTGYAGYKLMNPEALEGYEVQYPAYGHANLVVPDHDVNLTLHFAPLAPTTVEYVDTDGNLLTKFSDSSKASTSKSPYSDQDGIEDSKFMARAIDIPGYELVSDPVVEKPITQVSTKDDLNPMIIKFVYKKVAKNAEQGLPDGGGAGITGIGEDYGINWSNLPGGVSIDLVNKTYGDNSFEKTINNMDERYTKQGFSYIGVLNNHKDSDLTNRLESYVGVHFLPHKSVTVNYVDQDGKKLADSVELSFNKENPDQTNNGVNPKANWYPSGEWKSEQKSFDGYNLKTVRGATEGKFTTFNYTVTYVYTNQTSGNVVYIDDTDQKDLKDVALNGKIGSNIDYSTAGEIANYEKQGYELVSDDFSNGAKIFNADENKNKFTVHLKHKIETTTVSQDGNQVIHYVYADGSKAANDNEQTTTFVKTTKTDAVNGKVIESSWAPERYTFENVVSPVIENYHPDKENVKGSTVTPDNSKVEVTVTYIENGTELRGQDTKPSTQTVKFVDEEGHELKQAVVSPVFNYEYSGDTYDKFTGKQLKQGSWNVDSHTFDTVAVPVIDGYVAIDGFSKRNNQVVAGGLTSTRDNLNVVAEVVYQKVGKIIPVDPSGKPIPNVPTPNYSNDPTDPTKVVPDEPVPTVPKMTPSTPTVTPTDPGKDTPVPYTPETPAKDQVAIVNYVDSDEGNKVITTSGDLTGKAGAKIDYSTASTIQDLENKGYVLVNDGFPADAVYDNDDNTTQTYTVVLKHGTVPVTPTDPGKPGEPINPNDPDGPKWPDGTGEDSLKKTGTQTIHYVYSDGRKAKDDNVQSFDFTKSAVVDKVTGAIISQTGWNVESHTFGNVDTPVVDGYHADKRTAGGTTITPEDLTKEVTVTYTPNGKIIPVDPNGNPIPNVPTPQYPTDPTDPTKVTPDEPVPTVPGMTPSTPTVTPTDPGKDTPVPYTPETPAKDQVAIVNYVDSDEGNKVITTSGDLTGKAGAKIDYSTASTIQDLENKGYVLVNDGFPAGAVYDNDDNTTQTYTVVLKHGTTTITPDKPGKPGEPINPDDPDGPKWPQGTDENSVKRTGTQTIHYTGAGDKTPKDDIQSFTFTKTMVVDNVTGKVVADGSWNVDSHTFGNVNTPKIDGYHADKRTAGNTTITPDDLNKTVTVNYSPNGKIIPVDPNGKPIPNVPTPQYPTDPSDPTKVTPDEPVPTIPGYTPSTPTVTPTDPGKDTPVPYTPEIPAKDQVAIVNYVDSDEGNKIITTSGDLTGKAGAKIDYSTTSTIQDLTNKGYILVNDGFPTDAVYDNNDNTTQTYTVVLKHGTTTITPDKPGKPGEPINPNDPNGPKWPDNTGENSLTKTGTQTIHYTGAGDKTPKDDVQSFTFTKTMVVDNVTGKVITDGSWNVTSHTFGNVDTPKIDGYHADKRTAGNTTITPDDLNKTVTVNYSPNGKIIPVDPNGKPIPNVPTPQYPTDPNDPTKVVPDEPVPTIPGMTPSTPTVTPTDPGKDTPVPYNPVVNDKGEVNVFVHDNTTGQNLTDYGYNSGSEDVGTKVSYDKDKVITELTNKGYKVINPDVTIPGEIAKGTTNVTIYVEHDIVPVNPTNPGKPGQPINPNDPNGPKYPNGTDTTDLTRRVTRTINFVSDEGTVLRASIDQTIIFTANGELDKVTGKWTKTLTWSPDQQVNGMAVPFIDGYHVVNISKDGDGVKSINSVTLSHTDQDYVVNVVYSKNGQINPVKDQVAIVNYIDSDENNKLIITSGDLTGKAGAKIDYSTADIIQDLENKGYVLVNDGFPANAVYDHDDATTRIYTVILKHGIVPVTPDKPENPGQPINPNDPNGPKWPQGTDENSVKRTGTQTIHYTGAGENTPKDDVQEFTFTKNMSVDKVTGQIVDHGSWNVSSYTFGKVDTPVVDGYHADQLTAGGTMITPDDLNKTVTVNYVPNDKVTTIEGKQIIHFVDGNNTPLRDPDTQSHTFKITNGKSDTPDYTFNIINVPVIDGYVAEVKTAGGKTITPSNPLAEVTVVYHKIGKIVPVDPSGKPIPNAPTPSYKNDPTDPTKVTPDEPVPNVPGYRPQNPSPITPDNPTKDTNVPYTKDPEAIKANGKVTYIDDTTGDTIRTDTLQGNVGDKITYTTKDAITNFENKGYELVSNNFKDGNETFAKDGNDFEVHFKHQTIPVTPDKPGNPGQPINPNDPNGPKWPEGTDSKSLTKIGTQTVHYQGADGQTPKDNVSTVEFKHEVLVDKVTGKIVKDNGWTPSQTYKAITTPTINGYTPDKNSVGGETVTLDQNGNGDINKSYTVTYKKNAVPTPEPQPTPETVIGKQTITFVDGDNNTQLRDPNVQTHKFTNGESSYTFGTINVPVIEGYVAEVTTAGGKTVTPANPDASVVVVYHKIGKIVPVDPNHNPIPDAPAPKYQNDPTDPTKVVPNEPTPDVPGYTPTEKTVTPQSPTEDTQVVYEKPGTIETVRPLPQSIPTKAKKSPATHTVTENKPKKEEHIQTVKPHAANVIGRTGIVRTNTQTPAKNTVVSNKQTVQSTVSSGSTKQTLPQTGQANDSAAIVAGSLAAGLGLIGLAGVKKRKDEK